MAFDYSKLCVGPKANSRALLTSLSNLQRATKLALGSNALISHSNRLHSRTKLLSAAGNTTYFPC